MGSLLGGPMKSRVGSLARSLVRLTGAAVAAVIVLSAGPAAAQDAYPDLLALYDEFREVAVDPRRDGLGDYGPAAMTARRV